MPAINQEAREANWIAAAQNGESEAFSRLVEAYQMPVYNLCYRMLGNARDAEDAAQEAFLRAYRAIKRYDPERKFSTWLLSIASNYCIDQHRRRKLPSFSYDALPDPDIKADGPDIEGRMTDEEEQDEIRALLETLGPKDRAAVILHYWHELSYEEIAEQLSLSVSAVKSRLHRARRDLAESWLAQQSQPLISERSRHGSPA